MEKGGVTFKSKDNFLLAFFKENTIYIFLNKINVIFIIFLFIYIIKSDSMNNSDAVLS